MERRRLAVRQAQLEEEERLSGERRRARRGLDLAEVRALGRFDQEEQLKRR